MAPRRPLRRRGKGWFSDIEPQLCKTYGWRVEIARWHFRAGKNIFFCIHFLCYGYGLIGR